MSDLILKIKCFNIKIDTYRTDNLKGFRDVMKNNSTINAHLSKPSISHIPEKTQ